MSAPGQGLKVFISYAREDGEPFAKNLRAALEAAGFDAFIDAEDIAPGEPWEDRLNILLRQADTVVYVITPAAVGSKHCIWEIDQAAALSKRLLPVVAIDVPDAAAPPNLRRLNYIFFSRKIFGEALNDLVRALRSDLTWIREHTRLDELAARWTENDKSSDRLLRGSDLEDAKSWLHAWKTPAPEPTTRQRQFIADSEAAESARNSVERQRLRRMQRLTNIAIAAVAAVFVISAAGAVMVANTHAKQTALQKQLDEQSVTLEQTRAELAEVRSQLDQSAGQLAAVAQQIETAPAQGAERRSEVEAVRENIEQLRQDLRAPTASGGWRVDIFWCEALGEANQRRAETVALQLRNADQAALGFNVGQVRVRTLSAAANARAGYRLEADELRPEETERTQGAALAAYLRANGGPALRERISRTATPAYLSVFLCGPSA